MPVPTIDDVARAAGVSKATVSRVLSGNYAYIRAETRKRVELTVEALNYRPSTVARSLSVRRTHTLGILVSDVGNPYYPDVIHGVEDVAFQNGYQVFLANTNYDVPRGMDLVQSLIDRRVDGLLIMSSAMSDEYLQELIHHAVPFVVVDWDVQGLAGNLAGIRVDFETGIREAAAHLVALGHRRFAHISGPLELSTSQRRRDFFLSALAELGIDPRDVRVVESNLRIDGGRCAMRQLLEADPRPTAVFAANDLSAFGALSSARSLGLAVPDDLSVVGLDDIWLAAEMEPPLTTVMLPRYEIGAQAVRMLLELITNPQDEAAAPLTTTVESALIIRSSTRSPRLHP